MQSRKYTSKQLKTLIIFVIIALFIIIFTILAIYDNNIARKNKHYPKYDKIIAEWQEQYDKFPNEGKEESICYVNENDPKRRIELLRNCISIKSENVEIATDNMLSYSKSAKKMKKGDFKIFFNAIYIDSYNYIKAEKITMFRYIERNDINKTKRTLLFFENAELISKNGRWQFKKDKLYSTSGTLFSDTETVFEDSKTEKTFTLNNFWRYMSDFNSENFTKEPLSNEMSLGSVSHYTGKIKIIQEIIQQYERKKSNLLNNKNNTSKNSSNSSYYPPKTYTREELEKLDAEENEQERLESDEYEFEDREEREYWEGEEYWKDEGVEIENY